MRCKACNANLTDREATRKSVALNDYTDLCDNCMEDLEEEFLFKENIKNSNRLDEE